MALGRNLAKSGFSSLAVLLAALLFGSTPSEAVTLDWNTVSWTAGSLSQSFNNDAANPGNDITITISGNTSYMVSGYPVDNTTLTGGQGSTRQSLDLNMLVPNATPYIHVNITFNYAYGVTGANFMLFDIDGGTGTYSWQDQVRNLVGSNSLLGTSYAANITGSPANIVSNNNTLSASVTGTNNAADNTSNGNATVSFGTNVVTSISFDYGNAPGFTPINTGNYIGLYDILYGAAKARTPEVGPGWAAVMICGLAVAFRHRRQLSFFSGAKK